MFFPFLLVFSFNTPCFFHLLFSDFCFKPCLPSREVKLECQQLSKEWSFHSFVLCFKTLLFFHLFFCEKDLFQLSAFLFPSKKSFFQCFCSLPFSFNWSSVCVGKKKCDSLPWLDIILLQCHVWIVYLPSRKFAARFETTTESFCNGHWETMSSFSTCCVKAQKLSWFLVLVFTFQRPTEQKKQKFGWVDVFFDAIQDFQPCCHANFLLLCVYCWPFLCNESSFPKAMSKRPLCFPSFQFFLFSNGLSFSCRWVSVVCVFHSLFPPVHSNCCCCWFSNREPFFPVILCPVFKDFPIKCVNSSFWLFWVSFFRPNEFPVSVFQKNRPNSWKFCSTCCFHSWSLLFFPILVTFATLCNVSMFKIEVQELMNHIFWCLCANVFVSSVSGLCFLCFQDVCSLSWPFRVKETFAKKVLFCFSQRFLNLYHESNLLKFQIVQMRHLSFAQCVFCLSFSKDFHVLLSCKSNRSFQWWSENLTSPRLLAFALPWSLKPKTLLFVFEFGFLSVFFFDVSWELRWGLLLSFASWKRFS